LMLQRKMGWGHLFNLELKGLGLKS